MKTLRQGLHDTDLLEHARASSAALDVSPEAKALLQEWAELCEARKLDHTLSIDARRARDGRSIFIVHAANGYHESYSSYEDAIRSLVSSHRTRVEDLESTHRRYMALARCDNVKLARKACAELAARVDAENPDASAEDRDGLVLAAIEAVDAPPRRGR